MNTIEKNIRKLPYFDMPEGLHERIVRKILIMKLRIPFLVVLSIISLNLIISSWHLWARLAENETLSIMATFLSGLEFDYASIIDTAQTLWEITSPFPFFMFLTNIALIGYVSYIGIIFIRLSKNDIIQGRKI